MYIEQEEFEVPNDGDVMLWRYMDFGKFVAMLSRRSMFFVKMTKLMEVDPYEGVMPGYHGLIDSLIERMGSGERIDYREILRVICVSCWHMSEYESSALWRLYSQGNEGVAIKSTFNRLVNSFKETERAIGIGKVEYVDFETDVPRVERFSDINVRSMAKSLMQKRRSFEFERELRAVVFHRGFYKDGEGKVYGGELVTENGMYVPVDLNSLIHCVYVSPLSEKWFREVVQDVVDKYGLKGKDVIRSDLRNDPID